MRASWECDGSVAGTAQDPPLERSGSFKVAQRTIAVKDEGLSTRVRVLAVQTAKRILGEKGLLPLADRPRAVAQTLTLGQCDDLKSTGENFP